MENLAIVISVLAGIVSIGLFATKAEVQSLRAEINRIFATKNELTEAYAKFDRLTEKLDDLKQFLYMHHKDKKEL